MSYCLVMPTEPHQLQPIEVAAIKMTLKLDHLVSLEQVFELCRTKLFFKVFFSVEQLHS